MQKILVDCRKFVFQSLVQKGNNFWILYPHVSSPFSGKRQKAEESVNENFGDSFSLAQKSARLQIMCKK